MYMSAQGGTFFGPSGPAAVPGSADQMGGPHTGRRGQRHGQHRAHVGNAGLRSGRQPAHVRRTGRDRSRSTGRTGRTAAVAAGRDQRQRRPETTP